MEKSIEQRATLAALTKKEKQALDYIVKHQKEACFLSTNEIGQKLGMGGSSVVRLAKKLGYANYGEMRRQMQNEIAPADGPAWQQPAPYKKIDDNRGLADRELLAAYTQKIIGHIYADANENTEQKLSQMADAILAARRVYVAGFRACAGFAASFVTMLGCCRGSVLQVGHGQQVVDVLADFGKEDLLIVLSFSRYSKDAFFAAQMAKNLGGHVAVMTDSLTAPLAEYADLVVLNSVENFSFFNAYTSFVMNMEKTALLVSHRSMDKTQKRLAKMEEYLEKTNQY